MRRVLKFVAGGLFVLAGVGLTACGDDPIDADGGLDDAALAGDAAMDAAAEGCGDGVFDRGSEVCDDGNTTSGDGCSADCTSDESCGNGVVDDGTGERCDDGNEEDGDGCRGDCLSDYRCGNGVLDTVASGAGADEACDDGNTANGDGCSAACDSDESCGNSIVDLGAGEVCDDGNEEDGDDCSADCRTSLLCGNGELDGAEECDDGNNTDGDDCSAACLVERCGNGRLDADEACDDGNAVDDDGCANDCTFTCSSDADCGDADVCNGTETCSGPGTAASACTAGTALAEGDTCATDRICRAGACVDAVCGDGFVNGDDECDDANVTAGDGCEADCTFTCSSDAGCSDGEPCSGAEMCVSAGTTDSRCMDSADLADGIDCGGGNVCNAGVCASPDCGDGIVSPDEACDDGNRTEGDGCDNDCGWTCESGADCTDSNACNGAEVCSSPGTLDSRCGVGTPPAAGTDCGGGNICRGEACVMPRCGDGLTTGTEECDDANTTLGDGCENSCSWTCENAGDCDDGALCNGAETCSGAGTLASRCDAGTAPSSGTVCDADGMPGTRDVCDMSTMSCALSECGDGVLDTGASPAEECDDGNTMNGDLCSSTCTVTAPTPPTGFRIVEMELISPRIVANIPFGGCQDITSNCARAFFSCQADSVNTQIATALDPTTGGGTYSLHLLNVFQPLAPTDASTPVELHTNPECVEGSPDACAPGAPPELTSGTASNRSAGTCYAPDPAEVNLRAGSPAMYAPTANSVSGPCFSADYATLSVNLSGIVIPLTDATVSGTYAGGSPPTRIVSGIITGFLSSADATTVILPDTIPVLGNNPLYNYLQAGDTPHDGEADACNLAGGTDEDDRDESDTGFRFFLNFEADAVGWTP